MIDEAALAMHPVLVTRPETAHNCTPGVFVVLYPLAHSSLQFYALSHDTTAARGIT